VYLGFAALVGLAWSSPLAAAVGGVTGAYPRGDAEVFDAGGVMLVEAARRMRTQMAAIGTAWSAITLLAVPLGVVVLAFAIALLATPGRARPVWAFARAVRSFWTLTVIGLVAVLADVVLVALILLAGGALVRETWPVPPARDVARFGLFGCAILAVLAVGVLHDLARAATVAGPSRAYVSLRAALRTARRSAGRTAWAYTWRSLLGLAAVVAAAWLGARIGHRSTAALVASTFVHQLGVALLGWMRLSWLAQAVTLIRPSIARPEIAPPEDAPPERMASENVQPSSGQAAAAQAVIAQPAITQPAAETPETAQRDGAQPAAEAPHASPASPHPAPRPSNEPLA